MISHETITHEFVETVPEDRDEARIYISIRFRTAVHNCLCGCGEKVVTPIKPHKWVLTYDGETISLAPSVGNWSFACQSHYFIRNSRVIVAGAMDDARIARVRAGDVAASDRHYGRGDQAPELKSMPPKGEPKVKSSKKKSIWQRLFGRRPNAQ